MKLQLIYKEVVGLMPVYTEAGNATQLLYTDCKGDIRSLILSQRLESVKLKWARLYALDLKAQARNLQKQFHRSVLLPFYTSEGKVFVPFKLREAKVTGDAIYGYVCLEVIAQIKKVSSSTCLLVLANGDELPVYSSIETAKGAYYLGVEIFRAELKNKTNEKQELIAALQTLRRFLFES